MFIIQKAKRKAAAKTTTINMTSNLYYNHLSFLQFLSSTKTKAIDEQQKVEWLEN